jgi:hypothetical protein
LIAKEKGAELAHVLIGREKDGNVYAKSANHPIVVLVKKDDADRLIVPLSDLIESQK